MPYFITESVRYFFKERGDGKENLIMLHGFTGQTASWKPIEDALAKKFRLLMIDLPGHGETDSPADTNAYRMENVARDLWQMVQHLSIEAPILYGYSMGGRLALYMAVHYQFSKLILESSSPGLATENEQKERKKQDDELADRIKREGIEAFVDFWENIPLFESQKNLSEKVREYQRELRLQNNPIGLANSLRGMGTGVQPSLWDELNSLDIPVLLMAGQLDEKFVNIAGQMHDLLPQSDLITIDGAGHAIHIEKPDAVASAINALTSA